MNYNIDILHVDDERYSSETFVFLFEFEGYNVKSVLNPETANMVLNENNVRLIISDNLFPGDGVHLGDSYGGIKLYKSIRKLGNQTPFILLTNHSFEIIKEFITDKDNNFYFMNKADTSMEGILNLVKSILK